MKNSKIPLWPLYAADSLMFLTVLAIVASSFSDGSPLGAAQTFFCCVIVLIGMLLSLAPYWFEYRQELARKAEHTDEAKKNFDIIFEDLASLRLALADLVERVENDEAKSERLTSYEKALIEFKDSIKKKFAELSEDSNSLKTALEKCADEQASVKNTVAELDADFSKIRDAVEAEKESISDKLEKLEKSESENSERVDATAAIVGNLEDFARNEIESLRREMQNFNSEQKTENIAVPQTKPVGGMLARAFGNAADTRASVEKFVERLASESAPKDEESPAAEEPYDTDGERLGEFPPPSDEIVGESPDDDFPQDEPEQESPDEPEPERPDVSEQPAEPASPDETVGGDTVDESATETKTEEREPKDERFFERADSSPKAESAVSQPVKKTPAKSDAPQKAPEPMLFDALPVSREKPVKPKKSDSVIVVNALIGIGNKPFLRADCEGLSPDSGTPMDYIEIGKWRYVLPNFDGELNFKILKNDKVPPNGESDFKIAQGEKLELNLAFPMETED